jgi:hypothetical protein
MPRPRTERPTLDGDHTTMTDLELRRHYFAGCGHDSCRAAANEWKKLTPEQKAEAKADESRRTIAVLAEPYPAVPAGYVNTAAHVARTQLQALFALGYDEDLLEHHLPMIGDEIRAVLFSNGPDSDATDDQARAIGKAFQQLRSTPPSTASRDARSRIAENREYAKGHGWVTPDQLTNMDSRDTHTPSEPAAETFADRMNARIAAATEPPAAPTPTDWRETPGKTLNEAVNDTLAAIDRATDKPPALAAKAVDDEPAQSVDDLREEVTFLTLGLEVRAELYAELQATNRSLSDDLARTITINQQLRMEKAALQVELFATRYEIGELKDLAFHLAEQAPPPEPITYALPIRKPARGLLAAINARLHPGPRRTQESA